MISRKTVSAFAALFVVGAISAAAPALASSPKSDIRVAALPLPRVSGQDIAPTGNEPGVTPMKPARRGCVFGVFPQGHGRCFAAAPAATLAF